MGVEKGNKRFIFSHERRFLAQDLQHILIIFLKNNHPTNKAKPVWIYQAHSVQYVCKK
jgi:hypothetical protein